MSDVPMERMAQAMPERPVQSSAVELGPLLIDSIFEPWWKNFLREIGEMLNPPKLAPLPKYRDALPGEVDLPDPNVPSLSRPWWMGIPDTLKAIAAERKFPPLPQYRAAAEGEVDLPPLNLNTLSTPWFLGIIEFVKVWAEVRKLPPLELTFEPVAVKEIWGGFDFRRQGLTVAAVFHVAVVFAIFGFRGGEVVEARSGSVTLFVPVDISPYLAQLRTIKPPAEDSGGGGGGGAHSPMPASRGRLPRFSLEPQLAPPTPIIRNEDPELAVEPTVRVPPNLSVPQVDLSVFGDPLGADGPPSAGPGSGGGIGSGTGTGVGSGTGSGVGPGSGGGIGGGVFRIGGGVSSPRLLHKVEPEYSEEARKAKYQGTVMLAVEVWEDGIAHNIRVVRSLGLGLDEKAMQAVRQWRFAPGRKDGKPVRVAAQIQVSFRLL